MMLSPYAMANSVEFYVNSDLTPLVANPGDTIASELSISNFDTERDAEFTLSLQNYPTISNEDYTIAPENIAEWELAEINIVVEADSVESLMYDILVPEETLPGKYYFVVNVGLNTDTPDGGGVTIGTAMNRFVFVNVTNDDVELVKEEVDVENIMVDSESPAVELESKYSVNNLLEFIETNISYINLLLILLILMRLSDSSKPRKSSKKSKKK